MNKQNISNETFVTYLKGLFDRANELYQSLALLNIDQLSYDEY